MSSALTYRLWGLRCCTEREFDACWYKGLTRAVFCAEECDAQRRAEMVVAGRCDWMATAAEPMPVLHIVKLRYARGLSQRDLARRTELSQGHIGNVEKGRVRATQDVLERIAAALECGVEELVG